MALRNFFFFSWCVRCAFELGAPQLHSLCSTGPPRRRPLEPAWSPWSWSRGAAHGRPRRADGAGGAPDAQILPRRTRWGALDARHRAGPPPQPPRPSPLPRRPGLPVREGSGGENGARGAGSRGGVKAPVQKSVFLPGGGGPGLAIGAPIWGPGGFKFKRSAKSNAKLSRRRHRLGV